MIRKIVAFVPFFYILILATGCSTMNPQAAGTRPVKHDVFTALLQKYVDDNGLVDYDGFLEARKELSNYLVVLSDNPPNDQYWSREEKLAYWINVYNAFTIDIILDHHPLESIKDIGSSVQVPFLNTPWDIEFVRIGDKVYTLNNVEHNILRKVFDEPRIHFAINCASMSCPKLRKEAYQGQKLEQQLAEQTRLFLEDTSRNIISKNHLQLSKIFQWFGSDFNEGQTKLDFVDQWTDVSINKDAKIDYLDYDWSLNQQGRIN